MDAALEAHLIADAGDEVVEDFIEIDRLQQVGIAAADIKKCKEAGFYTVKGLAMSTRKTLTNVKGLSENKVEKMLEGARKLDASAGWMTGGAVKAQV
ncbi:hypothetical protein CEUSTIGMA_g2584.t1 [Chlamydomonas eustigma]|uniref:DNA recombination and repair protein Rad51-like C-terminal domain-containing protein n=1 Tax=Chlamydomonas eustigma TaxID=1157962 RepID=A0A250WX87_9CHLO|nr:hypothetical protein CEUSTIGMA_g2584.t1 [Chlamydomonas eustigma]|eukprot:GAX75140.1 hypothetical protein CEUSTIGMA_g2584.t1 [Chlamydomonas eustigma]